MPGFPFPITPVLSGIAIAYQNGAYVADQVLPRLNPILSKQDFKYLKFGFDQQITIPNTLVGRKGSPDTIEFQGTEVNDSTKDYGLDDVIPIDDINNAPQGYDPKSFAVQRLTDLVLLDREVRVANKVFAAGTYAASNKILLSGTTQWSHASSTPIKDIAAAADSMPGRPNKLLLGRATWTSLRTNPTILAAISFSGTDKGMATKQAVADLLELEEIIIGESWLNSAKPGQTAVRQRVWGKHATLFRSDKLATSMSDMPTFGWTAQYGGRVAGEMEEPKIGLRGAIRVRAGESVQEVISAADLGYFFENATA